MMLLVLNCVNADVILNVRSSNITCSHIIAITQLAGNYLSFTIQQVHHTIVSLHNPLDFESESENLSYHIISLTKEKKERSR